MGKIVAAVIALLVLGSAAVAGDFAYESYVLSPKADADTVSFVVEKGEGVSTIGTHLREKGVVDNLLFFKAYVRLSHAESSFLPGTFQLRPGMSFRSIVGALSHADVEEVQVTIPEGYTVRQIGERVRAALPKITEDEWKTAVGTSSTAGAASMFVSQNKPAGVDLEGYLFPDTYRFYATATAEDVVAKMLGEMSDKLSESLAKDENGMSLPGAMTPHEVLTLASIVEREVRDPKDMKDVADIFLKRLKMGMPLQADSTIAYYLSKTSAEMTVDDLKKDNPFNTYTRAGLPPGPISNPGLNAIDAVTHPTSNPYLYFLTTSDGTVVYAATFDEHIANKNRYLR
ncbi:MAG: endolytic transglycosylase MltG [Candidatus Uhrbacteria bacterium]